MFQEIMDDIRRKFGEPPRRFSIGDKLALSASKPLLMPPGDRLIMQYQHRKEIFRTGKVVWGHIIQANEKLFLPGSECLPAAWLYSLDPHFDEQVEELEDIALDLFDTKGEETGDPELQRFADTLADEYERIMSLPIPKSVTGGRDVTYTVGNVHRRFIPTGRLAQSFFPLVVAPSITPATWILPSRWWSEPLVAMWRSG